MNTRLSLPSIRLPSPAALTTPPHFMPEYINNLSLLLSLLFIFALHRTRGSDLFTPSSLRRVLFLFSTFRRVFHNPTPMLPPPPQSFASFVISNPGRRGSILLLRETYEEERPATPTSTSSFQNGLFPVRANLEPGVIGREYVGALSAPRPSSALASVSVTRRSMKRAIKKNQIS